MGFSVRACQYAKSRVESGVQCVTNGAENSTSTLAKPNIFSLYLSSAKLRVQIIT